MKMNTAEPIKGMTRSTKKAVLDAIACSIEIVIFGYFISFSFPYKTIAFIPLFLIAFIISRHVNSPIISFLHLFRKTFTLRMSIYLIIGFQLGMAAAMYYRGNLGMPVLPDVIKPFSIVAVSIGIMEELFFRGFIQTQMNQLNAYFAIFFSALAHAAYKASLFLSPNAIPHEHLILFFVGSFGAFIVLGLLRQQSKNLLPAIVTHAVFDLVVYSEVSHIPWWVW